MTESGTSVDSRLFAAVIGAATILMTGTVARAAIIHQSATMGLAGLGSGPALGTQLLGSRFTLTSTKQVRAIGGHLGQNPGGQLFGAIISLAGPSALPSGTPFDGTTLAATTFTAAYPSTDFRTSLSVTLPPGTYALIFGAGGYFGATGIGFMPEGNTDIPGSASYFFWNGSTWYNGGLVNVRFVVEDAFCGDTFVDIGEQCDDGNTLNGDCCSSTCQYETAGSSCPADVNPCTDDVCDGAGSCGVFNTDSCDDGDTCTQDDVCDGAGTCAGPTPTDCDDGNACTADSCVSPTGCVHDAAPADGCLVSGKSLLLIKNDASDDTRDKVIWRWMKGEATSLDDLGVPTGATTYTLCLYAGSASAVIALPAGSNWQASGTKGYTFKDTTGTPDGAQKAVLKSGDAGRAKAFVKGKGTNLPDTLAPALPLPVTAQLVNDSNSTCFEATYNTAIKNDAKHKFKAKTP